MPTVNGPDEITDLEAGNDKVFYSDNSGDVTEVALGASGTVLTSAGATSAPTFSAIPAEPTVGADKIMYSNSSDVVSGVAFGAAGTVLTSAGATSAPSWVATAGGAEGSFTANGSIAAGRAVVLDAAGTVSELSNTLVGNAVGDGTTNNSSNGWNSGYWSTSDAGKNAYYDKSVDTHVVAMNNYQYPSTPYYNGIILNGFATNSSDLTVTHSIGATNTGYSASNNSQRMLATWYDDTGECGYAVTANAALAYYGYVFNITSDGSSFTSSTFTQYSQNDTTYSTMGLYVPDLGYSLLFWQNSTGTHVTDVDNGSAGSSTITVGGNIATATLDSTAYTDTRGHLTATYDTVNNAIIVAWQIPTAAYSGGPYGIKYIVGTVSGGSITWGTVGDISTTYFSNTAMAIQYRSFDDKFFLLFCDSPDINYTGTGTLSGTTMTWDVFVWPATGDAYSPYYYKGLYPALANVDDGLQSVTVFSTDYGFNQVRRIFTYRYDSITSRYIAYTTTPNTAYLPSGSTGIVNFSQSTGNNNMSMSWSPDHNRYLWAGMVMVAPYYLQAGAYQPTTGADNSGTYFGIAQSTVTNGQSVDVKWLSSKDTQQSGLTIGGRVYASSTGVLSNTSSVNQVGFAISATDVILTKVGSEL